MSTQKIPAHQSAIIDVIEFLDEIVSAYSSFEKSTLTVTKKISHLTLDEVKDECSKLKAQRDHLQQKDSQLIQILDLTGKEIHNHTLVDEYRIAFANATAACDSLFKELIHLKTITPKEFFS